MSVRRVTGAGTDPGLSPAMVIRVNGMWLPNCGLQGGRGQRGTDPVEGVPFRATDGGRMERLGHGRVALT
jgi:hypothetical protein